MGKAIVYCGSCGKSLLEEDFEKARAVRTAAQCFCARCSPIDVAALPAPAPARATAALPSSSTTRIPKMTGTGRIPTTASTRRIKPAHPGIPTALWLGLGALAGVLVLAFAWFAAGPARPRPSAGPAPAPPAPPPARHAAPAPKPSSAPSPAVPPRSPSSASTSVEEQMRRELAALRAHRLEQDLQEARRLVDSTRAAERSAEIDALLDALSRVAGPRLPEVIALRTRHEQRMAAAPPEVAELPTAESPTAEAPGHPAGLEGHWTLDRLDGGLAHDASGLGRHAAVVGHPKLVPGRHGQAVLFEGDEAYIEMPRRGGLDRLQEGPYSVCAWFKPTEAPKGPEPDNGAFYGIVLKPGLHVGLSYTFHHGGTFEMMHWLQGVRRAGGYPTRASPPGTWHHVAGTADPEAARTRLYVNGELALETAWPDGSRTAEGGFTRKTWRIGIAVPKAKEWGWSAKGAVDDVRLYSRVLPPAEIQALASGR